MQQRTRWMVWALALAVVAAVGYGVGRSKDASRGTGPEADAAPGFLPAPTQPPAEDKAFVVTVVGGVLRPGAYPLPEDARVQDLVDAAGGLRASGTLDDLNIAAPLVDGSVLTVPERPGSASAGSPYAKPAAQLNSPAYTRSGWLDAHAATGDAAAGTARINLNTASQTLLETLPGVGPVTAQKIIEYRNHSPFRQVEDLVNISGVGEKTLESLRPHVVVR